MIFDFLDQCGDEPCDDPLKDTGLQAKYVLAVTSAILEDINDLSRYQKEALDKVVADVYRYVKFAATKQETLVNSVHGVIALETENAIAEQVVVLSTGFPGSDKLLQEQFESYPGKMPDADDTSGVKAVADKPSGDEEAAGTVSILVGGTETAQAQPPGGEEVSGGLPAAPEVFASAKPVQEFESASQPGLPQPSGDPVGLSPPVIRPAPLPTGGGYGLESVSEALFPQEQGLDAVGGAPINPYGGPLNPPPEVIPLRAPLSPGEQQVPVYTPRIVIPPPSPSPSCPPPPEMGEMVTVCVQGYALRAGTNGKATAAQEQKYNETTPPIPVFDNDDDWAWIAELLGIEL